MMHRETSSEIHKLALILLTYLFDYGFFKETIRTDLTNLKVHTDNMSQQTYIMNQYPFEVEYV